MAFAENTTVTVQRSRAEIEATVAKYGASQFLSGYDSAAGQAVIGFSIRGRQVRFHLVIPTSFEDTKHKNGRVTAGEKKQQQEERRRWRALALCIKAKLEAVESGIVSFDEEFLAHIVTPDGRTFGHHVIPQLEAAYATGEMPKLLPAFDGASHD